MPFGYMSVTPKEHRERKPFQAFRRANDLRKENAEHENADIRVGNPWREANKSNWLDKAVGILVISFVLFCAFFIWKGYTKYTAYETKRMETRQAQPILNAVQKAAFLTKSGFDNLNAGDSKYSKIDFENALKLDPKNVNAANGLVIVLTKYCELKGLFCKEAEEWQTYLSKISIPEK